jgi:S-adenosylmethionine synthetase
VARSNYLFTSESVSEGHPDKVCDRISDEVVDLYYRTTIEQGLDVWSLRCAAETLATTNKVVIAGEFRGTDAVTKDLIAHHARMAIKDIGYDQKGFSWRDADIEVLLHGQSEHIAQGVDASGNKEEGAGDQGIMFGYATNETPELMPAPIQFSHRILKLLADARHSGKEKTLAPDAKSQVTVRYENGKPKEAVSIVLSTQHTDPNQTIGRHPQDRRALHPPGAGRRAADLQELRLAHQPDGQVRHRRTRRRLWPYGPQNHRRHIRRCSPARRRRLLGQGPDQG